jgi:hypothetical protein
MVFAVEAAPSEREAFLEWYDGQTEWEEDHGYDDPAVSEANLQSWFKEMIESYPAMNGPYSSEDLPEDDAVVTDYSIGRSVIYAAFAWSKAEEAYEAVFRLAGKHGVGFFDASSDEAAVWVPDGEGGLKLSHKGPAAESSDA